MTQENLMHSHRFNSLKGNRIVSLVLTLTFLLGNGLSFMPTASAAKTGSPCNKLNSKSADGSKQLVCIKNSTGKLIWSPSKKVKISNAEFRKSLQMLKVEVDEFKGNYEIFPKGNLNQYILQGTTAVRLTANITKRNENSPWIFGLTPEYSGEDWLNLDEVNIKSASSVLNYSDVIIVNSNVLDGGRVYEIGRIILTNQEAEKFCKLINEQDIKFRLSGSGGKILQVTGDMPVTLSSTLKASCQVFGGLLQGFKP